MYVYKAAHQHTGTPTIHMCRPEGALLADVERTVAGILSESALELQARAK